MITRQMLNPHRVYETDEINLNLKELEHRLNLLIEYGAPITIVTSGLRSEADQARINPSAPKSKHLVGAAADIASDGMLHNWVVNNIAALEKTKLWCEDPSCTKGWIHFQIYPPRSGKRFFIP